MSKSDAPGYKIFEGGVMWFLGKSQADAKPVAGLKKVPGYIQLGRSVRDVPSRTFEGEFWEKIARDEKVARRSKIFRLNPPFEGRSEAFALGPRFT